MWDEIMASIHAEALDCLQANLAVLADRWHGAGTHLRLGAALGFAPQPATPLPTVDPGLAGRLTEAQELLGLVVRERYSRRARNYAGSPRPGTPYTWWPMLMTCHGSRTTADAGWSTASCSRPVPGGGLLWTLTTTTPHGDRPGRVYCGWMHRRSTRL